MSEDPSAQQGETLVRVVYEPPSLTKVGNVRELLAGEGGTVTDIDPDAGPLQASPQ
jgi:hypothetical protein